MGFNVSDLKLSRNFTRTKTQVYSEQFREISGTLSRRRVVLQQHSYRVIFSTLPCAVCASSSLKLPVKLKVWVLVLRGFYRSLAPVESHSVTGTKLQLMRFFLDLFCRVKINAVHRSVKMQPLWSSALYINATFWEEPIRKEVMHWFPRSLWRSLPFDLEIRRYVKWKERRVFLTFPFVSSSWASLHVSSDAKRAAKRAARTAHGDAGTPACRLDVSECQISYIP